MDTIIETINEFISKSASDYETEELTDYQETFETWDEMDDMTRQAIDRALWTVKAELARRGY